MFKKYKNDLLWILITLFIMVMVSLAQMYSREVTLYKINKAEFKLFNKILDNKYVNEKYFKRVTSPLVTKKGYALFQIALISQNKCIENTSHYYNNPLICTTFKNYNKVEKVLNNIPNRKSYYYEFSTKDLNILDKQSNSYLIKKLKYTQKWLIAKNNLFLYNQDNEFSNFRHFVIYRYIQTNGYKKIFEKGKFLFIIIFIVSFLLWLANNIQNKKYLEKYRQSKNSENETLEKIKKYEEDYNRHKLERYEQREIINQKERELLNNKKSQKEFTRLKEEISILYKNQEKFTQAINSDKEKIINLEHERLKLQNKLNKELSKLSEYERSVEQLKIDRKVISLKKLWSKEPTWIERREIEGIVSLKKTNLPFTITQAFIAFDKSILSQAQKYDSLIDSYNSNIYGNIELIVKNKNLTKKLKEQLHQIRKARNRWFHDGIYPNSETIDNLVTLLHKIEADVFI